MKIKGFQISLKGLATRLLIILMLAMLGLSGFFAYKIFWLKNKLESEARIDSEPAKQSTILEDIKTAKSLVTSEQKILRGQERGRINILLLGMGGEGHSGKYLTDTIILASINPKTYQSALLSIPRDLYIKIPESNIHTKINAVYTYELRGGSSNAQSLSTLKKLIKEVTGQQVDYYIGMDFDGFKEIIDELGGVEVEVEDDIIDTRYPGPNFSYETFEIDKGFHHLDGETALKYCRVRHTAGGDFGRAARQQQVMAAAKKKATALGNILNPAKVNNLINLLGEHLKTDIALEEIPSFLHLAENVNIYQTTNRVLDAWSSDSLLGSSHVELGGVMAYVLLPRARNYSQIHDLSENIFDLEMLERKRNEIEKEDASITVAIRKGQSSYKIQSIFRKLGYKNTSIKSDNEFASSCKDQTLILARRENPKVFTMDDILEKFEAKVSYQENEDFESDILVCLSDDAEQYFEKQNLTQEEENQDLMEESIINKEGEIRVNER